MCIVADEFLKVASSGLGLASNMKAGTNDAVPIMTLVFAPAKTERRLGACARTRLLCGCAASEKCDARRLAASIAGLSAASTAL